MEGKGFAIEPSLKYDSGKGWFITAKIQKESARAAGRRVRPYGPKRRGKWAVVILATSPIEPVGAVMEAFVDCK
jgi:hypothetical protein